MSALPDQKYLEDAGKHATGNRFTDYEAGTAGISPGNKLEGSFNVTRGAIRIPSPDPSISPYSGRRDDYVPDQSDRRYASRSPRTIRQRMEETWYRNKGLFLVLIAQFFGTLMNITTRMLEMEGNDGKRMMFFLAAITNYLVGKARATIRFTYSLLVWESQFCVLRFTCGIRRQNISLLA